MEEFARIKDEVPSVIMDAHMKNVKDAQEAGNDNPNQAGLEKSGIAGWWFARHIYFFPEALIG